MTNLNRDKEQFSDEDEFLRWLDNVTDIIADNPNPVDGVSRVELLNNAMRMNGIKKDLRNGDITFEEALERYEDECMINA